MFKKLTSMVLAGVMALSVMASVTAADINQSGGSGDSKVTLDINSRNLKVTVPSVLPIWVDSDNNVTVATNAKIQNRSDGPVDVTDVSVEADNNWSLVDFNTDFSKVPVDTKQYGMTMYNDDVIDGVDLSLFDRIDGSDEIAVVYNGNVAIQSSDINKFDIGHVVFTVAWAAREDHAVLFNGMNSTLQNYMSLAAYDPDDYSYSYVKDGTVVPDIDRPDKPAVGILSLPAGAKTVELHNSVRNTSWTDDVTGKSEYEIKNLIPNEQYTYTVKDASGNVLQTDAAEQYGDIRMIDGGDDTFNIRDFGGWQADGGKLKYGLAYRGGELNDHTNTSVSYLSDAGKSYFRDYLGIVRELDLRYNDGEGGGEGTALDSATDYVWFKQVQFNTNFNALQKQRMGGAVNAVMNSVINNEPIYIHCVTGADRTQHVSMLCKAVCGVSLNDLDRDFEMTFRTNFSNAGHVDMSTGRERSDTRYVDFVNEIKAMPGATFRDKAIALCVELGVSLETINAFRHAMIDGNPQDIKVYTETTELFDSSLATQGKCWSSSTEGSMSNQTDALALDYVNACYGDVITISSDVKQNNFGGNWWSYDKSKAVLGSSSSTYNGAKTVSSDQKSVSWNISSIQTLKSNPNYNPCYFRFTIQYSDINAVSVLRTRTLYHE